MNDRSPTASRTVPYGWKLAQFLVLTIAIVALEQVVEIWILPGPSADLALAQLEPSDSAAGSLRLYETLRAFLPSVTAISIFFVGVALLVPGYGAKARGVLQGGATSTAEELHESED